MHQAEATRELRPVDLHIHLVGRGDGGTGCYVSPKTQRSFTYRALLRLLRVRRDMPLDETVRYLVMHWISSARLAAGVLLAQDAVRDPAGNPLWAKTPFYTPNDYVAETCAESTNLYFGASVHPARRDAREELERCAEMGAVLLKIHPVIYGIDLMNPNFKPFFRRAAELGMPLLVHCGVINALQPKNQNSGMPTRLRQALDEGCTVIAAHAGRATPLTPPHTVTDLGWMFEEYPNLYTDTAALAQPFMLRTFDRVLRSPLWVSRMVHGSDFPVPPYAAPIVPALSLRQSWRLLWEPNPILRDVRIKQAMGCPREVFRRGWDLMRKA